MITITIGRNRLRARGHAADGIGCAAVSSLLYALAGGLENHAPENRWHIGSGEAEIHVPDTQEAQSMRLMAEIGLRQLAAVRGDIRVLNGPPDTGIIDVKRRQ